MGYIYKIQNKKTGEVFIGQTQGSVEAAVNSHFKSKEEDRFHKDLRTLGREAFEVEVIDQEEDEAYLDIFTSDMIAAYNSYRYGYNEDGGFFGDTRNSYVAQEFMDMVAEGLPKLVVQLKEEDLRVVHKFLDAIGQVYKEVYEEEKKQWGK